MQYCKLEYNRTAGCAIGLQSEVSGNKNKAHTSKSADAISPQMSRLVTLTNKTRGAARVQCSERNRIKEMEWRVASRGVA